MQGDLSWVYPQTSVAATVSHLSSPVAISLALTQPHHILAFLELSLDLDSLFHLLSRPKMTSNPDDDHMNTLPLNKHHPMSADSARISTVHETTADERKRKDQESDMPPNPLIASLEKIALTEKYTKYVLPLSYTLYSITMDGIR